MNSADSLDYIAPLGALGSGLIAGVFFVFSACIMRALAALPSAEGIRAMQRINLVILNPLFLSLFLGTALCALGGVVAGAYRLDTPGADWVVAAGLLYLTGTFGVTILFNVPRNELLAKLKDDSTSATMIWQDYLRTWTAWNHVRTIAGILSSAAFIMGCMK